MPRCGVVDIVIVHVGMEHGKTVVMLGGDDDVFHAGGFGDFDPFISVKIRRIKLLRVLRTAESARLPRHHPKNLCKVLWHAEHIRCVCRLEVVLLY